MKKYISIIAIAVVLVCGLGIATYAVWDMKDSILEISSLQTSYNVKITTGQLENSNISKMKLFPALNPNGSIATPDANFNEYSEIQLGEFWYNFSSNDNTVTEDTIATKANVKIASISVMKGVDVANIFTVELFKPNADGTTYTSIGTAKHDGASYKYTATADGANLQYGVRYTAKIRFTDKNSSKEIYKLANLKVIINLACVSAVE